MLDLSRFDYETYRDILTVLEDRHRNASFVEVKAGVSGNQWYILRHDIDYSPESALRMAKIENEMGVRSVYFLLLNSPFYNLLSPDYIEFPRALVELGHEVGLHYDGAVFESQSQTGNIKVLIDSYLEILSSMSGQPIECASMHNPSLYSGEDFLLRRGFFVGRKALVNAYDPLFIKDATYISDSFGAWRDNALEILTKGFMPPKIQVLVHPLYWNEQHFGRWECMESAILQRDSIARKWKDTFAAASLQHEGVIQHDRRCEGESIS